MVFQAFHSWEEALAAEEANRKAADAKVRPWQAQLDVGDHFVQVWQCGAGDVLVIFGEVLPDDEPRSEYLKHYRFCKCWSVACPQGEMGDVHVSVVTAKLGRETFERAKALDWGLIRPQWIVSALQYGQIGTETGLAVLRELEQNV